MSLRISCMHLLQQDNYMSIIKKYDFSFFAMQINIGSKLNIVFIVYKNFNVCRFYSKNYNVLELTKYKIDALRRQYYHCG